MLGVDRHYLLDKFHAVYASTVLCMFIEFPVALQRHSVLQGVYNVNARSAAKVSVCLPSTVEICCGMCIKHCHSDRT